MIVWRGVRLVLREERSHHEEEEEDEEVLAVWREWRVLWHCGTTETGGETDSLIC